MFAQLWPIKYHLNRNYFFSFYPTRKLSPGQETVVKDLETLSLWILSFTEAKLQLFSIVLLTEQLEVGSSCKAARTNMNFSLCPMTTNPLTTY